MTKYIARYAHSDTDTPADLALDASNDAEAKAEIKAFVASGYRNGTWANIELADGSVYSCRNMHGECAARSTQRVFT